jgi:hypothetical protein
MEKIAQSHRKTERKEERIYKVTRRQQMTLSSYLSAITPNINGLSSPIKKPRVGTLTSDKSKTIKRAQKFIIY